MPRATVFLPQSIGARIYVQHHALCRKYQKVRSLLAVHASRAIYECPKGVAENAGTAQIPHVLMAVAARLDMLTAYLAAARRAAVRVSSMLRPSLTIATA
jgi:hypothetical protein